MPILPAAVRVAPSGGIIQANVQADNRGAVLSQMGGQVAQTAAGIGDTLAKERERAARELAVYNKQQDENDRLRDLGWADVSASEVKLQKQQAFDALKTTAGPNDNFFELWQKEERRIDDQAVGQAATSMQSRFLSDKLQGQREDFGLKAIAHNQSMVSTNATLRHDKKVEITGKALQSQDPDASDADLLRIDETYDEKAGDPNLALMPETEVAKRRVEDMNRNAKVVAERYLSERPEDLLRAMGGGRIVRMAERGEAVADAEGNLVSTLSVQVGGGKWNRQIEAAANSAGLNPNLVAAVMHIESRGRPVDPKTGKVTKSEAGALGLMQLMPATAREMGVEDPTDPDQNIQGGAKYLRKMMEAFEGDPYKALAAYNSGPGTVAKAVARAEEKARKIGGTAGPNDWRAEMRKFQSEENFKQTQGYLKQAEELLGGIPDLAAGEFIEEPGKDMNLFRFLSAEDINAIRKRAVQEVSQRGRSKRESLKAELSNRLESERAAYADGVTQVDQPVEISDFLRAGYDPNIAGIEYAQHMNYREVAPVIGSMKTMTKAQRDQLILGAKPSNQGVSDVEYSAKVKAYNTMVQAADKIERQLSEDAAGYAMRSSTGISRARQDYASLQKVNAPPQLQRQALDRYVAEQVAFQKANGIETPNLLPKAEADAIRAEWVGQPNGALVAGERFAALANEWGPHYGSVLRQLSKDLPSEALWIGQLADQPSAIGVRQSLAAASKFLIDKDIKTATGTTKEKIAGEIAAQFVDYRNSLVATDGAGGTRLWAQLEDGATKLAAYKMATLGVSATDAAKQAYSELVGGFSEFHKQNVYTASYSPGGDGIEYVKQDAPIRLPKQWPGKTPDQKPGDILDGAAEWLRARLDGTEFQTTRAQASMKLDVKERSYWTTNANDDGLQLMLAGSPVRRKDGSLVKVSWSEAASSVSPSWFSGFTRASTASPEQVRRAQGQAQRGGLNPQDAQRVQQLVQGVTFGGPLNLGGR